MPDILLSMAPMPGQGSLAPSVLPPVPPEAKASPRGAQAREWTVPAEAPHVAPVIRLPLVARPHTRGDCAEGARPCPWLACRHHLLPDRQSKGQHWAAPSVLGPRRPLERWTGDELVAALEGMAETCAIDLAERGGMSLAEVAEVVGVTRERIRQIEAAATRKLRRITADLNFTEPAPPATTPRGG